MILLIERRYDGTSVPSPVSPAPIVRTDGAVGDRPFMPRGKRICPRGTVFHVLNRGNQRQRLFYSQEDYEVLVRVIKKTLLIIPTRILAYCVMPNHWHVLLWPERDWELSDFMHQMTTTHVRQWHKAHPSNGGGHVYQGGFSFP